MSEADTANNQSLPEANEPVNSNPVSNSTSDFLEPQENSSSSLADESERSPADKSNLVSLAEKLKGGNSQLLNQGSYLEQTLKECQQALQLQMKRSQAQDTLLSQQTEELNTAQEQVSRLFRELESSYQVAQRQQILVETLSGQLETSQERVAQLERECAFIQQRYNDQSQQVLHAANICKELRTRLHRQQRQTLQFKAALEKCLEVPATAWETREGQEKAASPAASRPAPFPKAQPIQPWSAQPELLENSPSCQEKGGENNLDIDDPNKLATDPEFSSLLAQQPEVEKALQMLATQEEDLPLEFSFEFEQPVTVAGEQAGNSVVLHFQNIPPVSEDEVSATSSTSASDGKYVNPNITPDSKQTQKSQPMFAPSNSPSPLVYPLRPTKGLKSLAAVELPTFPRRG